VRLRDKDDRIQAAERLTWTKKPRGLSPAGLSGCECLGVPRGRGATRAFCFTQSGAPQAMRHF